MTDTFGLWKIYNFKEYDNNKSTTDKLSAKIRLVNLVIVTVKSISASSVQRSAVWKDSFTLNR